MKKKTLTKPSPKSDLGKDLEKGKKIVHQTLDKLIEKYYGKRGSPLREMFEAELSRRKKAVEIISEDSKQDKSKGYKCACCGLFVKSYTRPITSSMCVALILMNNKTKQMSGVNQYIHIEDFLKNSYCPSSIRGDAAKLKYWGLIKGVSSKREDGSDRNGYYKVTKKGQSFISGKTKVPCSITFFNSKIVEKSKKRIGIKDALNQKFSYDDLMNNRIKKITKA